MPANEKANFDSCARQNCKKSAVKHSIEKPILLNFVNLYTIFVQDSGCYRVIS